MAFAYEGTDLGRGEEDLDQFVITPLLDDEVRLAVPEGHAVSHQENVELADLAGEPWIAGCPRCRGHLLQLTPRRRLPPRRRVRDRGLRGRAWAWSPRAWASR